MGTLVLRLVRFALCMQAVVVSDMNLRPLAVAQHSHPQPFNPLRTFSFTVENIFLLFTQITARHSVILHDTVLELGVTRGLSDDSP